jgi:hypothetical protein
VPAISSSPPPPPPRLRSVYRPLIVSDVTLTQWRQPNSYEIFLSQLSTDCVTDAKGRYPRAVWYGELTRIPKGKMWWRDTWKDCNEQPHNLYPSPNIITRWVGHVACMRDDKCVNNFGRKSWWEQATRLILGKQNWKVRTGCIWLRRVTSGGILWASRCYKRRKIWLVEWRTLLHGVNYL